MYKVIEVPTSEMEIVRCPKFDVCHGGECYALQPKCADSYYFVGSQAECQEELEYFKRLERL